MKPLRRPRGRRACSASRSAIRRGGSWRRHANRGRRAGRRRPVQRAGGRIIARMHLVIPFARRRCPRPARRPCTALSLPHCERLLARLTPGPRDGGRRLRALTPPHEHVLAARRGWARATAACRWPPGRRRPTALTASTPADQAWGLLTPTHWQVGTEQVVPARPGAAASGRRRIARAVARPLRGLFEQRRLGAALGRAAALVCDARVAGRAAHRLARPRHRPHRSTRWLPRPARRRSAAAPAERGADAAVHAPDQRRARSARRAAGELVLAQRLPARTQPVAAEAPSRCSTSACAARRWPTTGPPGPRPGRRSMRSAWASCMRAPQRGDAVQPDAVRRAHGAALRQRAARRLAAPAQRWRRVAPDAVLEPL